MSSPVSLLLRPLSDAWALAHAAYQFVYDTIDRPQCRWWPIKQPLFRCPSDDGVWLRDVDKAQINAWFKGDIDRDGFVPCSELHWGLCNVRHVQVFGIAFWRAMKMYIPVHFIPVLLYKRGKLFKRYAYLSSTRVPSCPRGMDVHLSLERDRTSTAVCLCSHAGSPTRSCLRADRPPSSVSTVCCSPLCFVPVETSRNGTHWLEMLHQGAS